MELFVIVFVSVIAFAGGARVSVPPKDTVAEAGSDVTLTCETYIQDHETDYLEWKEYISSPTGYTIFNSFNSDVVEDPYKHEIHGEYNLLIKSVALEDGGMYSCKLSFGETTANNADLIVIGEPELILPDMHGGKNVTITCKVKFGARRPDDLAVEEVPQMRVLYNGQEVPGVRELYPGKPGDPGSPSAHIYEPSIIIYTANVTALSQHDGENLTCEVYTTDPEFTTYVTETVDVKYGVNSVIIEPRQDTYEVGDVITCTANGNPVSQVKWSAPKTPWAGTSQMESQSSLPITEDMATGVEQEWLCTATNILEGYPYSVEEIIAFTVSEPKDPSGGGGAEKIGVSIATAILALALAYIFH